MTDQTISQIITGRSRDLGDGVIVSRILPSPKKRSVGPFVFLDQIGPVDFAPGKGLDVRPHPHIGLSTLTFLFDGELMHRDSVGAVQVVAPGDVNWMTAGRGIVHSERTAPDRRAGGQRMFGMQAWVALPAKDEEIAPAFDHHPASSLPRLDLGGASATLIAGNAYGARSPVNTHSPIFYLDVRCSGPATFRLPEGYDERAVYLVNGAARVGSHRLAEGELALAETTADPEVQLDAGSHVLLLGGDAFPEPRTVWWNLVSSRPERIEQAKADWVSGRFDAVPGETEFIPLPED